MDRKDPITKFIANLFVDELSKVYRDYPVTLSDQYNALYPTCTIQWLYDDEFRRIFIYYSIEYEKREEFFKYLKQPEEIYFRIAMRLINETYSNTRFFPEILVPQGKRSMIEDKVSASHLIDKYMTLNNSDDSYKILRPYACSYWYCDQKWRFLENHSRYVQNIFKVKTKYPKEWKDKIHTFEQEVLKINEKYDFYKSEEEIFKAGFEEFSKLYQSYFGRELFKADEENIERLYVVINT